MFKFKPSAFIVSLKIVSFNPQGDRHDRHPPIFRPATRLAAAAVALLAGILAAPAAFASNVRRLGLGTPAPGSPASCTP